MRLGVVIADTYPDKAPARFAVERTLSVFPADQCLLLSDSCFVPGARHVSIDPFSSLSSYNELILDQLPDWTDCDFYLVIQWDGFAIGGEHWSAGFLDYDYIGAPWLHLGGVVGAGGFSLRSCRLLESLKRLRRGVAARDIDKAEDLQICFDYRSELETLGLRFAEAEIATAFAFERSSVEGGLAHAEAPHAFGFHGFFNLPLVLSESELLGLLDSLLPRMRRSLPGWHLFVLHAWHRGYEQLGIRALAALGEMDAHLWGQVAQSCLRRGMPPAWLRGC